MNRSILNRAAQVLLSATALAAVPARALGPFCGDPVPGAGPPKCSPNTAGDPVHIGYGTIVDIRPIADLDIGGGARLDLSLGYTGAGYTRGPNPAETFSSNDTPEENRAFVLSVDSWIRLTADSAQGGPFHLLRGPQGVMYPFEWEATGGYFLPIDRQNHTRLRLVDDSPRTYEWIQANGEVWTYVVLSEDEEDDYVFAYLTRIDAPSHESAHAVVLTRDETPTLHRHQIKMAEFTAFGTRLHFRYKSSGELEQIDICDGCSAEATATPLAHFSYSEVCDDPEDSPPCSGLANALVAMTYGSGGEAISVGWDYSVETYGGNGDARLVDRIKMGGQDLERTVAEFEYGSTGDNTGMVIHSKDAEFDLMYDYNTEGTTTITDLEADASVVYNWITFDHSLERTLGSVTTSSPSDPMKCIHCNKPVEVRYDRYGNFAAENFIGGAWNTRLLDTEMPAGERTISSGDFVSESGGDVVLTDSATSFTFTADSSDPDVPAYWVRLEVGGVRYCPSATPDFGYCPDIRVNSVTGTHTLKLDLSDEPTGAVTHYAVFTYPDDNSVARPTSEYGAIYGGNVLRRIENDQRWNGSTCVDDDDAWTLPPSACAAETAVTDMRYDNLAYPSLLTSTWSASQRGGSYRKLLITDYDPPSEWTVSNATIQGLTTCPTDDSSTYGPHAFNGFESADARPQRIIEFGYSGDGSTCQPRVWTYNYSGTPSELVSIDGPLSGSDDTVTMAYFGSSGANKRRLHTLTWVATAGSLVVTLDDYDLLGEPTSITDLNGGEWTVERDVQGQIVEVTSPSSAVTTTKWGPFEQPRWVQRPKGNRLAMTFDEFGRPTAYKRLAPGDTPEDSGDVPYSRFTYADYQRGIAKTIRGYERYSDDGASVAEHATISVDLALDEHGHAKHLTSSRWDGTADAERTQWREFTPAGLLETETWAEGDASGTAPTAKRQLIHDGLGRLTEEKRLITVSTTAALRTTAALFYDAAGYFTKIRRYKATSSYAEDEWAYADSGATRRFDSADAGETNYTPDASGRIASYTTPESTTITLERDAFGRVTKRNFPSDADEDFVYDIPSTAETVTDCITAASESSANSKAKGRLRKVVEPGKHTFYYGYTAEGRLAYEGRKVDGDSCASFTRYEFDGNGNVTKIKYPVAFPDDADEPRIVEYVYGTSGADPDAVKSVQILKNTTVTEVVADNVHVPFASGDLIYRFDGSLAHQLTYQLRYNKDGSPQQWTVKDLGDTRTYMDRRLFYDAEGNVTAVEDALTPFRSQRFGYDELGRMNAWKSPQFSMSGMSYVFQREHVKREVTLDWAGNRLSQKDWNLFETSSYISDFTYVSGTNKIDEISSGAFSPTEYGYTASGKVDTQTEYSSVETFSYDQLGRQTEFEKPWGNGTYPTVRDYASRRWSMVEDKSWGADNTFAYEFGADGTLLSYTATKYCAPSCLYPTVRRQDYIYLAGRPVAALISDLSGTPEDSQRVYIAADHLGTPVRTFGYDPTQSPAVEGPVRAYDPDPWGKTNNQQFGDYIVAESSPGTQSMLVTVASYSPTNTGWDTTLVDLPGGDGLNLYFNDFNICDDTLEIRDASSNTLLTSYTGTGNNCGSATCNFMASWVQSERVKLVLVRSTATTVCGTRDGFKLRSIGQNYKWFDGEFEVQIALPGQFRDLGEDTPYVYNWHRTLDSSKGRYLAGEPVLSSAGWASGYASSGLGVGQYSYVAGRPLAWIDFTGLAPGDLFPSRDAAARDLASELLRRTAGDGNEWGGLIESPRSGTYTWNLSSLMTSGSSDQIGKEDVSKARDRTMQGNHCRALVHTHPQRSVPDASTADTDLSMSMPEGVYIVAVETGLMSRTGAATNYVPESVPSPIRSGPGRAGP